MSNTYAKPELWNSHALVTDDGKELKKGSVVKDHRGDKHKVVGFQVPHHSGSSGRVFTKHGSKYQYDGQFFPSVVGAKIKERKFSSAGEHVGYHKGFGEEVEVEDRNKNEETISERDRSEYQANMQLGDNARKKPGHYLVRNGTKISGPHDSMDNAYSEYKKLDDIRGVKIQHMREEIDIQEATEKKVKAAAEKAVSLAKKKMKGKTANTEPELPMPNTQTSQPALMGSEQESESKGA